MEPQKSHRSAALIDIIQLLLVFITSIMGSEIAENLQLSPIMVYVITIISLLFLSAISYLRNHDMAAKPMKQLSFGIIFSRFIPKTVIGIFPVGLALGLILGSIAILAAGNSMTYVFNVSLLSFDFFGIICGVSVFLLFAIIFDGPLAGGLSFGYGLSFSTGALLIQPFEYVHYRTEYYLAYVVGFAVYALILAISEPKFAIARRTITEPRL
jgi:hypothetical protein